jgi:hypothetical protein
VRIGLAGGLVGMLCCVGPTVLLVGAKAARWRLALVAGVAVATYGVLYGLTTLAGALAR